MKIEFEGRPWQFELDGIDMAQGDVIAEQTGLSILGWYKSLLDTDSLAWAKSMRCFYWVMHDQNGDSVPLDANFAPLKLMEAFGAAIAAESPPDAEQDPTKPAGKPGATEPPDLPAESPAGS